MIAGGSNYKAIHFDMDGVIANTESYHMAADHKVCLENSFDIDVNNWDRFKGRTTLDMFTTLINEYGDPLRHSPKDFAKRKTDILIEMLDGKLVAIDGVLDFLIWARDNHVHMSLVTSSGKRMQQFITDHLNITDLFDVIITGDDITEGKPQPQPYLLAIEKLGTSSDSSIVIEDSMSGILSAQRAGCDVLAITTSHSRDELLNVKPTYIASDYIEACNYLGS